MAGFYLKRGTQTFGPFAVDQLKVGVQKGQVKSGDAISKSTDGPWTPVEQVKGLMIQDEVTTEPEQTAGDIEPVAGSPREYNATEISQLKTCRNGFITLYIAVAIFAVTVILVAARVGLYSPGDLYVPKSAAILEYAFTGTAFIAFILTVVGTGFFMATPQESGGRRLFQISFLFVLIGTLISVGLGPLGLALSEIAFFVLNVVGVICFYLGLVKLMEFVGNTSNAKRAQSLVVLSPLMYFGGFIVTIANSSTQADADSTSFMLIIVGIVSLAFLVGGLVVLFKYTRLLSNGIKSIKEAIS